MTKVKEIILIVFLITVVLIGRGAYIFAQTESPSPSPRISQDKESAQENAIEKNIKNLKEKIASKVSEITKDEQNIAVGHINNIDDDTVEIATRDDKKISASIDDTVTQFFSVTSGIKKTIKKDGLKKGDFVIIIGPHVEGTITANAIYQDQEYSIDTGQVVNIDKENFTFDIVTVDKEELTLDVESNTKQTILDTKTQEVKRGKFSTTKIGDRIHFVYKKTESQKKTLVSADRLLVIPQEYFTKSTP